MSLRLNVTYGGIALILCCFGMTAEARHSVLESRLEGLPIAEIRIDGLHSIPKERVLGLFPCKVGNPFSQSCVETAERYLQDWGVFDSIQFSAMAASDGVHIQVTLREALLVGTVDLSGNYPFLEQRLSKRLSLRSGSTFTQEEGDAQLKKLQVIFERAGYENPLADMSTTYNPEQNDLQVAFHIHKGRRITLGNLIEIGRAHV